MNPHLLDVVDLKVHYQSLRGVVKAVDGVSFSIRAGDYFGLVGESGCGKSTLAKALIKILPPNGSIIDGKIIFRGRDLTTINDQELRSIRWADISYIPQNAIESLDPVYRISDQIIEAIEAHSDKGTLEDDTLSSLFELVGLNVGRIRDYPHQFSGGMRQRVMIAMAMVLNPSLIIADEPTTALDVISQDQILGQLMKIHKDFAKSVFLVTHDMSLISENCEKCAVMYAGRIVESGDTSTLFSKAMHPYTMGLMNAFPRIVGEVKELIAIPGAPPSLLSPPAGCRFRLRCPFTQGICKEQYPPRIDMGNSHFVECHFAEKADEMRDIAERSDTWLKK